MAFTTNRTWHLWLVAALLGGKLCFAQTPKENPSLSWSRILLERHQYREAILALPGRGQTAEKWILADAHFQLGEYKTAAKYFDQLRASAQTSSEKQKATMGFFESQLRIGKLTDAVAALKTFPQNKVPARASYAVAKALVDAGREEEAKPYLRNVPAGSEYGLRARYLLAAISLNNVAAEVLQRALSQIEKMPPLCVEDYSVRELAILAQARLWQKNKRTDLAAAAYERVSLTGAFAEVATKEMVEGYLWQAQAARTAKSAEKEKSAVGLALQALERFAKVSVIDWRYPELMALRAYAYGQAHRFDEAKLAYEQLFDHYRPLQKQLKKQQEKAEALWPGLALTTNSPSPLIAGVPSVLVSDLPKLNLILAMRKDILDSREKLLGIKETAKAFSLGNAHNKMAELSEAQRQIEKEYLSLAIAAQNSYRNMVADRINKILSQAEFQRAEVALAQMQEAKIKLNAARAFQAEKLELFENHVDKIDATEGAK